VLLGRPASLSAQPDSAAQFSPPLSPARGRRLAPPGAGHVAAVRRRRGRAAADRPYPGRDAAPRPQATPFCPLPAPLSFLRSRAQQPQQLRCSDIAGELRRSPPAPPVTHPRRQNHRCTRLRRGKPLRTLYRGERPPRALNRSPEFPRPRRSAPSCRNLLVSATFRLFSSAFGS